MNIHGGREVEKTKKFKLIFIQTVPFFYFVLITSLLYKFQQQDNN
jgi:hypothetical protein